MISSKRDYAQYTHTQLNQLQYFKKYIEYVIILLC